MDQILFLFDLDQVLPLEGPIAEESKQDARLNLVKQTCLRILTYCSDAGKIDSKRRDLPSFGFRFYSSTEYFSLPNQLTGDFHELSKGSFDILESALTERFERVVQGALREVTHTPDFFTKHENNTGRKSESETLRRSLEEIVALYNWDRPVLHSPVKKGQKTDQRIGNAIFVFTKLPNSEFGLRQFLPSANRKKKLITFKDVSDCVSSKRIKSMFSGEASISVHVVDTKHFHNRPLAEPVTAIFHKAFQDLKGSIIPIQALAERCFINPETEGVSVESSAQTQLGLPFSSALKTYLGEAHLPSKQLERNYSAGSLNLGDNKIGVGFPAEEGRMFFGEAGIEALRTVGLIKTSLFKPGQAWSGMVTIWGSADNDSQELQSVLSYLQYAGQCLLFEKQDGLVVLFYRDVLSASLAFLNKIDSCFYRLLLKLNYSEQENSPVQQQVSTMLSSKKLPPLQFSPVKKPTAFPEKRVPAKFDSSTLEPYRLPDAPCKSFADKLKKANRPKPPCEFMLKVRESYITGGGAAETGSNSRKKVEYDQEKRAIPKADPLLNKNSFEKKLSGDSLTSHTSRSSGSRPLVMSRGAAMRGAAKQNPKIVVKSAQDSKTIVNKDREMVLAEKAQKIQMIVDRVGTNTENTDALIDQLVVIKDEFVAKGDGLELACLAEATVSILLKRLDTVGISKTNLEEVVGSKLLFDVLTISRRYAANPHDDARIAEHKVQVLFRSEVHWLLARKESLEAYENEILQHLRQISLYGSPQKLTSFLLDVMVECFVTRQPELLCTLFDELEQERPPALLALFSPAASLASVGPSSGKSSVASYISCSSQHQQQHVRNRQKSALLRMKSFDANTSHSRQINLGAAANKRALRREKSIISTTGRMVTKPKSGIKAKVLANPLKQVGKSPKKAMKRPENVKRVLAFDVERRVASRKMVAATCKKGTTTPGKKDKLRATPKKQTPRKMTPGKQHRMLAPETPTHKINRRKSDGQLVIPETPEHVLVKKCKTTPRRTQASLNIRRKSSFYNGAGSRNAQRAEESMNASLIQGNVGFNQSLFVNFNDSERRESFDTSGELNKSSILFPHLMNKKRKRESGDDEEMGKDCPMRTVKRRLQSFSEDDQIFGEIMMDNNAITNTPSKQIHRTPKKFGEVEDLFSPNKKVQFNMVPMHPTPTRGNLTPKGILKTPSKTPNKESKTPNKTLNFGTPNKCSQYGPPSQASFLTSTSKLHNLLDEAQKSHKIKRLNLTPIKKADSPKKPPVKSSLISSKLDSPSAHTRQSAPSPLALHCSSKTPTKSPQRRSNIGTADLRSFPIFRTPNKSPAPAQKGSAASNEEKFKTPTKLFSPKQNDANPRSPIIKSSGKGKRFKSPMSSAWTSVSPRSEPKISITQLLEMKDQDRTPTPPRTAKAALNDPKQCSRSLMQNISADISVAQKTISPLFNPAQYSTTRDIGPALDNLQELIGGSDELLSVEEISMSVSTLPFPDLTSDIAGIADSLVEPDIPDVLPDTESCVIAEFSSPLRQNVDILQLVNSSPRGELGNPIEKFIDELKSPSKLIKPVTVDVRNCSPRVKSHPLVPEVKVNHSKELDQVSCLELRSLEMQGDTLFDLECIPNKLNLKPVRVSLSNISASSSESLSEKIAEIDSINSPNKEQMSKIKGKSFEAEDVDKLSCFEYNQNMFSLKRARVSLSNISASSSESINENDDDITDGSSVGRNEQILGVTYVVEKSNNSSGTPNVDMDATPASPFKPSQHSTSRDLGAALDAIQPPFKQPEHSTCRDLGAALDAIQPDIGDQKKNLSVIEEVSLEESSVSFTETTSVQSQNEVDVKIEINLNVESQLPVKEKPENKQNKKNKVPKALAGLTDLLTEYYSPPADGKRKSRGQVTPKTTPLKESGRNKDKISHTILGATSRDVQTKNNADQMEDAKDRKSAAPITAKRRSKGYAWITEPSEKEKVPEDSESSGKPLSRRRSSMNNTPQDVITVVDLESEEPSERRTLTRRKSSITESLEEDMGVLEPKRNPNATSSLSRRSSCNDFDSNKSLPKNKPKNSEWILGPNNQLKPITDDTALAKRNSVDDPSRFSWIGSPILCPTETVEDKIQSSRDYIYYKAFALGEIKVDVGDYVLVNGDNAGGNLLDCEVARVKYLFQDDVNKTDPNRAVVEWFCRPTLLPPNLKNKHGYEEDGVPPYSNQFEVLSEARAYKDEISVQTIYLKCHLQEVDMFTNPDKIDRSKNAGNIPTYLLRFKMVKDKRCKYYVEPIKIVKDGDQQGDTEVVFNGIEKKANGNPKNKLPKGYAYMNEMGDKVTLEERRNKKILTERRASFNNIEEKKPTKGKSLTRRKSCFDTTSGPETLKKYHGYAWEPVEEGETVDEVDEVDDGQNDQFSPAERAKLRRAKIVSEKGDSKTKGEEDPDVESQNEEDSDVESQKIDDKTYSTPQLKKHKGYAWVPKTPQSSSKHEKDVEAISDQHDKKYECNTCECDFTSKSSLDEHKAAHVALEDRIGNTNGCVSTESVEVEHSEWQCCYCHKFFISEVVLNPHMESCSSSYSRWLCQYCSKYFKSRDFLKPHKKECQLKSAETEVEREAIESAPSEGVKMPKVLAALQDNLSGYFSPHDGVPRSRSRVERLVDEVQKDKSDTGPSKVRRMSGQTKKLSSSQENTNPILQKRRKNTKETPQNSGVQSSVPKRLARTASIDSDSDSRRRSVRSTPRPSYAELEDCEELLDLDSSNSPEETSTGPSPGIPEVTPIRGLAKNPKRFRLASGSASDSPSVKEHFRETKRGSRRLSVKATNDSPVMKDVAVALDSSMEVEKQMQEEIAQVTPEKEISGCSPNLPFGSPGKYFSMGDVVESPGGHIKMKLIRTPKPNSVRRPLLSSNRPIFSSSHSSSKSRTTPQMKMQNHMISRLNRSACKDIGISPNKLHALIAASPSPKKKCCERDQVKEAHGVNRTPRIRIKKIQSFDQENEGTASWTSTVLSPKKCDPVGSPLQGISRLEPESPAKKSYTELMGESPARKVYSPLSSNSLYKLQSSPIIHTTIAEHPGEDDEQEPMKKKRRVNKQLYA